jgi:hypothetical protein
VATRGETKEPEEGCLLAEGVRCRENGCLSRGGGGSGIGRKSKPAPVQESSTGDTGVTGRSLRSVSLVSTAPDPQQVSRPKRGQCREAAGLIDELRASR